MRIEGVLSKTVQVNTSYLLHHPLAQAYSSLWVPYGRLGSVSPRRIKKMRGDLKKVPFTYR